MSDIVVHHLNDSRSQRILWLLEELGLPYAVKSYQRDATTRLAPPELKAAHALGKSPVVIDGDEVLAESGAIVETLVRRYGADSGLAPDPDSAAYDGYLYWLHFAEGSAMLPLMLNLYVGRLGAAGAPLHARIAAEIANHLGFVDQALDGRDYLLGPSLSAADIQMSFVGEAALAQGRIAPYPRLTAWIERFQQRPAYRAALDKGGPYAMAG